MGINNGTRLDFSLNDNPRDERLVHIGSIFYTLVGDYIGDEWEFLIIGNDERVLEFIGDTELVLGIVSFGEAGASFGHTGADEIPFQQVDPGEVRLFHSPSHPGTFHVSPCAIVLGSSYYNKTTTSPETATPGIIISAVKGETYNRVLVEGCCGPDSILCRDTKASKGC
eukprot:8038976-Heterocapsa_arctica.AAC.1